MTRRQRELTGLPPLPPFVQTSSDAKLDLTRDWDQFLHPLVAKYMSAKFEDKPRSNAASFIDAEGRFLSLDHAEPSCFVPQLLELLKAEKDDSIEIENHDKVRTCGFSPYK
jgi:hypothetical protein